MAPDEQTKGGVPGDGGVRTGKKNKQKIPQRGLGVAQLEKLRLEEQQKKASSSSSDPSTQAFGFPPQQQQQPYFPLAATGEGVVRPRVALVLPVSSLPVLSMSPPRPVVQDTSMPVLWNAGDPNASDGEAFATSFAFHVPPGSDRSNTSCRSRTPMTLVRSIHLYAAMLCLGPRSAHPSSCCLFCRRTWHHHHHHHRPWSPLQTKPVRTATTCCLAGESEREKESERGKRPCPSRLDGISGQTAYPCKLPSPANGIAGFGRDASSSGLRLESGSQEIGSFLTLCSKCSCPYASPVCRPGDVGQDERPFYSFIPTGPSSSETTTTERRAEAADGIDLNLKL